MNLITSNVMCLAITTKHNNKGIIGSIQSDSINSMVKPSEPCCLKLAGTVVVMKSCQTNYVFDHCIRIYFSNLSGHMNTFHEVLNAKIACNITLYMSYLKESDWQE